MGRKTISRFAAIAVFFLCAAIPRAARAEAMEIDVRVPDRARLDFLAYAGFDIASRHGDVVTLSVDASEIPRLAAWGFAVESKASPKAPTGYYGYDDVVDALFDLAATHPDSVSVGAIGSSETGRDIFAARLCRAPCDGPRVVFDAAIHGDEKIGTEVLMALVGELVSGSAEADAILDAFDVRVIPIANPDGHAAHRRANGNGVDLNRNFAINHVPAGGSDTALSESETRALSAYYIETAPAIAMQLHSGAEVVNYPFDSTPQPTPDEALLIAMSDRYSELSGYPIINGYDWYMVNGISEETSYEAGGALSVILELSVPKNPAAAKIPGYIDRNIAAMLDAIRSSGEGIRGRVTDAKGDPLEAVLVVDGLWPAYSSAQAGTFARVVGPGEHRVFVHANGHASRVLSIDTASGPVDDLEIALPAQEHEPERSAIRVMMTDMNRPFADFDNTTLPHDALFLPDGRSYSIGGGGALMLDLGESLSTSPEIDLTVFEDESDGADDYEVLASPNRDSPFTSLGNGTGTSNFTPVLKSGFRYVLIRDNGDRIAGESPGADIDAVVLAEHCLAPGVHAEADPRNGVAPLSVSFTGHIVVDAACLTGFEWDFGDASTSDEQNTMHIYDQPGEYVATLTATGPRGSASSSVAVIVLEPGADDDPDDDIADDDDDFGDDDDNDSGCGC
ncbi:DUF2817 domain-containing protein [bacterium]|nr:DUF2817 domain-containing protein [bacterium]